MLFKNSCDFSEKTKIAELFLYCCLHLWCCQHLGLYPCSFGCLYVLVMGDLIMVINVVTSLIKVHDCQNLIKTCLKVSRTVG